MQETRDRMFVDSGEVAVPAKPCLLQAAAIGSCVVVTACDPVRGVGGMAHVMLPGECDRRAGGPRTRFAADALAELFDALARLGADASRLTVCLVGGADVIGGGEEGPGRDTAASLLERLASRGIRPERTDLGGTSRRSCTLDTACGQVCHAVGDSEERTLWSAPATPRGPVPDAG